MDRSVRGRPGRLGRETIACQLASRLRCQRRTVSGRTSSFIPRRACNGNRCKQGRQQRSVSGLHSHLLIAELALQHGDLVA